MKLQYIDKARYRSKLNRVIVSFIVVFALLAILFGAILIALFADSSLAELGVNNLANSLAEQQQPQNNFRLNLLGVILALLSCAGILQQLKTSDYFKEVYYVWQLKQLQNIIYRRLKKITQAKDAMDIDALIILNFYYASLQQLYTLDDNLITISSLNAKVAHLNLLLKEQGMEVSTEQFNRDLLDKYK